MALNEKGRTENSLPIFREMAVLCALLLIAYFIYALGKGVEPIATRVACAMVGF